LKVNLPLQVVIFSDVRNPALLNAIHLVALSYHKEKLALCWDVHHHLPHNRPNRKRSQFPFNHNQNPFLSHHNRNQFTSHHNRNPFTSNDELIAVFISRKESTAIAGTLEEFRMFIAPFQRGDVVTMNYRNYITFYLKCCPIIPYL
jgi:hypothetical protein